MGGLERERDFYFGKLRDVEILLQTYEGPDQDMASNILKILYATEEDFVQVDDVRYFIPFLSKSASYSFVNVSQFGNEITGDGE